jgi:acyl-CoA reductase-like NAD-dependent aldehyde dehydrogenase
MAFGNTVVIKPSEEAPISAGLLQAEILEEAGFPAGSINVVTHAPGEASTVADVFFESSAVRSINFTGSETTARILGERAGRALKRSVLELGGYNPLLVLRDADIANAVNATVFGSFFHQGQICMNTRKVLIEQPIHDAFVEQLAAKTLTLKAGDPTRPETIIGPLINDRALASVSARVREATDRGARLVTGGTAEGRVYAPTILTHVPLDATVANGHYETFGPVPGDAVRPQRRDHDRRPGPWPGPGSALRHRHRPRQRLDHGRRAVAAQRRRQGQRLGTFGSLRDRGFHRNPPDHPDPRRRALSVLRPPTEPA